MLPQSGFFGKWKRIRPLVIILLAGLVFTAVILTTLSQSEIVNYLPVVFSDGIPDTPLPPCDVSFVDDPSAGNSHALVTDDVERIVSIVNLTTGETMGTDRMEAADGYDCPGLADYAFPYQLSGPLTLGHELQAQSDDGGGDTAVVSADITPPPPGISTAGVITTQPPPPPPTTITLLPTCGSPQQNPGIVTFDVTFTNWPVVQSLTLTWEGNLLQYWEAGQHLGSFTQSYTRTLAQTPNTYAVTAVSGNGSTDTDFFTVPCPTPVDLLVVGAPQLVSTPPIIAYQPVQFTAVLSNTGDTDVSAQFFVDLFIDPTIVLTSSIPITESDGYTAVSALSAQSTRVVTLTAHLGFGNEPPVHMVYAMVDSLDQINEPGGNNLSTPAVITNVTPAPSPTTTNTPSPGGNISGLVYRFEDGFHPQFRAAVYLIDDSSGHTIATTQSDMAGQYEFANLPGSAFTVTACIVVDGQEYYGYRHAIVPPQDLAYISLLTRPCPYPSAPSPTPTSTPTHTPTSTFTHTPTATETGTPFPICPVQFEGYVIAGQDYVLITGEVGTTVTIVDLTDGGQQIGEGTLPGPFPGHACLGFATISVPSSEVITGHVLAAISSDGTVDTAIVLAEPPTPTPTPTQP